MRDRLNLNLLRVFVAVSYAKHVSDAAKELHISQPSVSVALAKLREFFGDPLFVKTQNGMKPTVLAAKLIGTIEAALGTLDEKLLAETKFEPLSTRRTFTLGLSDIGEPLVLPRLVQAMARVAPQARVQTVAPSLKELERGLETGDVDLIIGYRPDLTRTNYFQQKLFTAGYLCLIRHGHPMAQSPLTPKLFASFEHIVVKADNRAHEELELYLAKRKLRRYVKLMTPHYNSVPLLIGSSDMLVTMPGFLAMHAARLNPEVRVVTPTFKLPRFDVKQYWHRRFHLDPVNQWLRGLLSSLFQLEDEHEIR